MKQKWARRSTRDEMLHKVHVTPPFRLNDHVIKHVGSVQEADVNKDKTHFFKNAVCIKSLFFFF